MKITVNPKYIDTEDGFELLGDVYEINNIVSAAIKNGFTDIRISEPDALEKIEYRKLNSYRPEEGEKKNGIHFNSN